MQNNALIIYDSTKNRTTANDSSKHYSKTHLTPTDKRSRKFKSTRQLNKAAFSLGQTRITEYFRILNEIQILSTRNKFLEESLQAMYTELEIHNSSFNLPALMGTNGDLLSLLMISAKNNASKAKTAFRCDDTIKKFMSYVKMLGGSLLYTTLHANLPHCIPSPSTVNQYIADKGPRFTEGSLMTDQLLEYLESRKLPLIVSVAEDGTRMIGKICFDPRTNTLVGFSLPLNENGMPITYKFKARNVSEIENHFTNQSVSTIAYCIKAQPLVDNVPPFTLSLFSTDNKFTALDVLRRWTYIRLELQKKGIQVLTYASDGDAKLLKAMKIVSGIGTTSQNENFNYKWFNCQSSIVLCFQDFIHILTKLRNRMLRASAILPFGNGVVSKTFLQCLLRTISKDKHGLTNTDIEPQDRQNMKSASKICEERTQNCLKQYIPGSQSTVLYLKVMRAVTSSMLDTNMEVDDRISDMWYGVFVLRIWRSWLSKYAKPKKTQKKVSNSATNTLEVTPIYYSLQENFISSNAYTCIEINAHSLVQLIVKLREMNRPDIFLPYLMGSQSCESTFRILRGMTSTQSTVVNFTMLEMINRSKKVQLQSDIVSTAPENIKFPRIQVKKIKSNIPHTFPTNNEMILLIEKARKRAVEDASNIGINVPADQDFSCQLKFTPEIDLALDEEDLVDLDDLEEESVSSQETERELNGLFADEADMETKRNLHALSSMPGELVLKNYAHCGITLNENSPYTVIRDDLGNEKVVRKSTICWLLTDNKHSLSSDRLTRVKQCELMSQSKLKMTSHS